MKYEEYISNPNKCLNCGKDIIPKQGQRISDVIVKKFCNSSCSAIYNNKKREKKHKFINCNKDINRKGKYCGPQCQNDYNYKAYIKRWQSGEENGLKGTYQLSEHIRKYLLNKYDHKCSICGWNKINPHTNKIPLEIEHIDGNYLNNKEENLTVLCPNCHSLTATYKGANKGKGRKARSKYY